MVNKIFEVFVVLLSTFGPFFKMRERKTNVTLIITWLAPQYESSHEHQSLVDKHAILSKLALIDSVNTKGLPKQCRLTLCKDPNDISL